MIVRVKICGITRGQDAEAAVEAGVHALGFIFYSGSQRYIDPGKARSIIRNLPPFVTPVGVFVNETREAINEIIRQTGIQYVQLSGNEQPQDCLELYRPVIKAFRLRQPELIDSILGYPVSAALLDGAPEVMFGGSGIAPDFEIAKLLKRHFPLILAGGLNPDNAAAAVAEVRPFAIDVNSGVETEPGVKNPAAIRLLMERLEQLKRTILSRN